VTADRVLVSSGNQHGMTAVLAALLSPGDLVLTEALTYPGMKNLAGLLSLRLQGVALDEQGMRPDALAAACRARSPKAVYCVPTLQNPTTSIMSEERRRQIAAVAREHGVLIVEDDVHGRIPERAPRPLSAFAPERAVYLTGMSKQWRGEGFADAARRRGVGVTPASAFATGRTGVPDAVRVCLGAARDRDELERGLRVLAELLGAAPEPAPLPSGP